MTKKKIEAWAVLDGDGEIMEDDGIMKICRLKKQAIAEEAWLEWARQVRPCEIILNPTQYERGKRK